MGEEGELDAEMKQYINEGEYFEGGLIAQREKNTSKKILKTAMKILTTTS